MIVSTRARISPSMRGTISIAFMFSTTCSGRDAPVMTVDTCGLPAHQASANCASEQPRSFAMSPSFATVAFFCSSSSLSFRNA